MAIGIFEVVFCLVAFCFMWYFIFKVLLMYQAKKLIKNINTSLEKQEGKKFVIEGRIVDIGTIENKLDPGENIGMMKNKEPGEKEVIVIGSVEKKPKKVKAPKKVEKPKKKIVKKSTKKKK